MNSIGNAIASLKDAFASLSENDISMLVKLSICFVLYIMLGVICAALMKINNANKKQSLSVRNANKRRKDFEYLFWLLILIVVYFLLRFPFEIRKRNDILLNGDLQPSLIYLFQGVFALLSAFAFYLGKIFLKYYKAIVDTPTAKVHSAIQGYVELEGIGKIDTKNTLLGPLTKRACLWYKYSISKKVRRNRSTSWHVIEQGESTAMVRLQDNTGECLIDVEKAEINFSMPSMVWYGNTLHPDDSPKNEGGIIGWLMRGNNYKYEEKILNPDEKLYAIGMFRTINGQFLKNKNKDIEIHKLLKQWKTNFQALLNQYDINKDGNLSTEEWGKVIQAAEEEIYLKYPELRAVSSSGSLSINILSNLALPAGKPFIISDTSQVSLINTYKSKSMVYSLFFILLMLLAYHFNIIYGWYLSFFNIR